MRGRVDIRGGILFCAHLAPCLLAAQTLEGTVSEHANEDRANSVEQPSDAAPDEEVVVVGRRTVRSLRVELNQAEDRVHDLFNTLNDNDELDIHCYLETHIDTHIKQRVCRSNYVNEATTVQAQAGLAGLRGELGSAQMPAAATIKIKNGILREKFVELLNENPEFRRAVEEFSVLRQNFDVSRRQILDSDER